MSDSHFRVPLMGFPLVPRVQVENVIELLNACLEEGQGKAQGSRVENEHE